MLRVICICTGNLCRSPLAEQLIRSGLGPTMAADFEIASAGVAALDGDPMHPLSAQWSIRLGGDPRGHRATYLIERSLRGFDLVLGMAREHRRYAVTMEPVLVKRSFTLREFARLASEFTDAALMEEARLDGRHTDPQGRLTAILGLLGRSRGFTPPPQAAVDDVLDPIGSVPAAFELSARQVESSVHEVVRVLRIVAKPGHHVPTAHKTAPKV